MSKRRSRREKRQEARRQSVLSDAQVALGWLVILILAALVGAIYVNQASRIAGSGRQVQRLQNRLDDLKRQNAMLERGIAEAQSLSRLEQEAIRLGFTHAGPDDIDYVVVTGYPSGHMDGPGAGPAPATPPPAPDTVGEVLWLVLQKGLDNMIKGESGE